jgi:glycosyltransferase involved in cell wall biosynthesis
LSHFSVITPSYNQARFIRATIDSVLTQDFTDFEYVVVDGGSTDGTVDILASYHDPRMSWISEPDRGQAHAINKGLARTNGDLITYINSDDRLLPGALSQLAEAFVAYPDADMIYGDIRMIGESGEGLWSTCSSACDLESIVAGDCTIHQPGATWRRSATQFIGTFLEDLHYVFDFEYWLRMSVGGFRLKHLPVTLAEYRLHISSKTVSQRRAFVDEWSRVYAELYRRSDLPSHLYEMQTVAEAKLAWQYAKLDWYEGNHHAARPVLRENLRSSRWSRRILAATMLADSYLGTQLLTRMGTSAFTALTDRRIGQLFPYD